jgi:eukaryotic-like serine/threonine-protein kinase
VLTPPDAVALALDLCVALERLHQMGVVHADVKPENVFLDGNGRWVLGDLGSAWLRANRGPAVALTPAFAAPEVWRGQSPTPAADVFGVAATVLFAATSRPPVPGMPPPVEEMAALFATHPELVRALDPDPRRRPRSATHLARHLDPTREPAAGSGAIGIAA